MAENIQDKDFVSATGIIQGELKTKLLDLPEKIMRETTEIRLRLGRPVILYGTYGGLFLKADGSVDKNSAGSIICQRTVMQDCFMRLCRFSIHSHVQNITEGYITVQGGHRVGICGTAVTDSSGKVLSVRDISSLNIRIAREKKNCSNELYEKLFSKGIQSVIIAGAPLSGKTTVLRDLVRKISDSSPDKKICVIDERQEIAAMNSGITQKDVGANTDVYDCFPKEIAVINALKTMSPHIIVMDELCKESEIDAIKLGVNSGVNFIVTVHASDYSEILKRPQIERLLREYSFNKLVLLEKGNKPGKIQGIYDVKELLDEIFRCRITLDEPDFGRDGSILSA